MNRPIRGPAFVELDEVTGLLRPDSLAKLLKPPPLGDATLQGLPRTHSVRHDEEYQYTTELEARRRQQQAPDSMKQGRPRMLLPDGAIDFSADMLVEGAPSRPMSSSSDMEQQQQQQQEQLVSVLSLKSYLLPSDEGALAHDSSQRPGGGMPEVEEDDDRGVLYVGGGESLAGTDEGILQMGAADGGSTLGPLGAGSSYLRPHTAPNKRKQPKGMLRPMTAVPSRQRRYDGVDEGNDHKSHGGSHRIDIRRGGSARSSRISSADRRRNQRVPGREAALSKMRMFSTPPPSRRSYSRPSSAYYSSNHDSRPTSATSAASLGSLSNISAPDPYAVLSRRQEVDNLQRELLLAQQSVRKVSVELRQLKARNKQVELDNSKLRGQLRGAQLRIDSPVSQRQHRRQVNSVLAPGSAADRQERRRVEIQERVQLEQALQTAQGTILQLREVVSETRTELSKVRVELEQNSLRAHARQENADFHKLKERCNRLSDLINYFAIASPAELPKIGTMGPTELREMLIEIAKQSRSLAEMTAQDRQRDKEVLALKNRLRSSRADHEADRQHLQRCKTEIKQLSQKLQSQEATIIAQQQANNAQRDVVKIKSGKLAKVVKALHVAVRQKAIGSGRGKKGSTILGTETGTGSAGLSSTARSTMMNAVRAMSETHVIGEKRIAEGLEREKKLQRLIDRRDRNIADLHTHIQRLEVQMQNQYEALQARRSVMLGDLFLAHQLNDEHRIFDHLNHQHQVGQLKLGPDYGVDKAQGDSGGHHDHMDNYHNTVANITGETDAGMEFDLLDINGDGVLTKDEFMRSRIFDKRKYSTNTGSRAKRDAERLHKIEQRVEFRKEQTERAVIQQSYSAAALLFGVHDIDGSDGTSEMQEKKIIKHPQHNVSDADRTIRRAVAMGDIDSVLRATICKQNLGTRLEASINNLKVKFVGYDHASIIARRPSIASSTAIQSLKAKGSESQFEPVKAPELDFQGYDSETGSDINEDDDEADGKDDTRKKLLLSQRNCGKKHEAAETELEVEKHKESCEEQIEKSEDVPDAKIDLAKMHKNEDLLEHAFTGIFEMAAKLRQLVESCQLLADPLGVEETMQEVSKEICNVLNCERASLFIIDHDRQELWTSTVADAGTLNARTIQIRIPRSKGVAGFVAQTGQLVNIHDVYADPRFDSAYDKKSGFRTRNILCCPVFETGRVHSILSRGHEDDKVAPMSPSKKKTDTSASKQPRRVMAVLQAINKAGGLGQPSDKEQFSVLDDVLIQLFAGQAATSLHHSMEADDIRLQIKRERELPQLLHGLQSNVTHMSSLQFINRVEQTAKEVLRCRSCTIFVVDEIERKMWCTSRVRDFQITTWNRNNSVHTKIEFPIRPSYCIAADVAISKKPLKCKFPSRQIGSFNANVDIDCHGHFICYPVCLQHPERDNYGTVVGVLEMDFGESMMQSDEALIADFATQITVLLDFINQIEVLKTERFEKNKDTMEAQFHQWRQLRNNRADDRKFKQEQDEIRVEIDHAVALAPAIRSIERTYSCREIQRMIRGKLARTRVARLRKELAWKKKMEMAARAKELAAKRAIEKAEREKEEKRKQAEEQEKSANMAIAATASSSILGRGRGRGRGRGQGRGGRGRGRGRGGGRGSGRGRGSIGGDFVVMASEDKDAEAAATKLQAGFRGFQARRGSRGVGRGSGQGRGGRGRGRGQGGARGGGRGGGSSGGDFVGMAHEDKDAEAAATKLQAGFRGFQARRGGPSGRGGRVGRGYGRGRGGQGVAHGRTGRGGAGSLPRGRGRGGFPTQGRGRGSPAERTYAVPIQNTTGTIRQGKAIEPSEEAKNAIVDVAGASDFQSTGSTPCMPEKEVQQPVADLELEHAATKLQAGFRGFSARRGSQGGQRGGRGGRGGLIGGRGRGGFPIGSRGRGIRGRGGFPTRGRGGVRGRGFPVRGRGAPRGGGMGLGRGRGRGH